MKKRKKTLTLLEIIIVIFIISLVTGAVGYSMKGTLDRGRAFRTQQAEEQLRDLLLMCVAEGDKIDQVAANPKAYLEKYKLAKNPKKLIEDGWGVPFDIKLNRGKNDFKIYSKALADYEAKQGIASDREKAEEE